MKDASGTQCDEPRRARSNCAAKTRNRVESGAGPTGELSKNAGDHSQRLAPDGFLRRTQTLFSRHPTICEPLRVSISHSPRAATLPTSWFHVTSQPPYRPSDRGCEERMIKRELALARAFLVADRSDLRRNARVRGGHVRGALRAISGLSGQFSAQVFGNPSVGCPLEAIIPPTDLAASSHLTIIADRTAKCGASLIYPHFREHATRRETQRTDRVRCEAGQFDRLPFPPPPARGNFE